MAAFLLEIIEGPRAGQTFPLEGTVELGRSPSATVILDDEETSRRHASVTPTRGGAVVEDLGSLNGTYVNDQPVGERRSLSPGDRIRIGLTVLELRTAEQPTAVRPVPPIAGVGEGVSLVEQPALRAAERQPAFLPPPPVADDPAAHADYGALARLVDSHVKHQTSVAALAAISVVGLVLIVFFGAR